MPNVPRKPSQLTDRVMHALGPRVRQLRQERGRSLRDLAAAADVSASLLSDIERGQVNPTVATLFQLTNALGVPAHTLFSLDASPAPAEPTPGAAAGDVAPSANVVRAGERAELPLTGGITWQRLTPAAEGAVEFIEMIYAPGASSGEAMHHHAGREYGLVLAGELTLQLGFVTHTLRAGDSVAFDSTTPHRLSNRGKDVLRLAWVNINSAVASVAPAKSRD
jgi:transcriptional regulator with XRE-family HTH domain